MPNLTGNYKRIDQLPRRLMLAGIVETDNLRPLHMVDLLCIFGMLAWLLSANLTCEAIRIFDRLHAATGMAWVVFLAIHLVLHQKWIVSDIQRYLSFGLSIHVAYHVRKYQHFEGEMIHLYKYIVSPDLFHFYSFFRLKKPVFGT